MNPSHFVISLQSLHRDSIPAWKTEGIVLSQHDLFQPIEENHAFNFQLWQAEDRARRKDRGDEFVVQAKREIDHYNQQRNDRMERIDDLLLQQLLPASPETCPVHSETPGMMIDRLSILALKAYHMTLQTQRNEVEAEHRQQCLEKLSVINAQQQQLYRCLGQLLQELQQKTRTVQRYHQFKMYNNPSLNPELYRTS